MNIQDEVETLFYRPMRRQDPQTKAACRSDWAEQGTISLPCNGPSKSVDARILRLVEASQLNGLPIDFLVTVTTPYLPFEFAVVFSAVKPEDGKYPLPVLWRKTHGPGPGLWVKPAPRY